MVRFRFVITCAAILSCTTAWAQTTTRVSVDSTGVQGNSHSQHASISADGRYVAFASIASNLVAGDTNGSEDIFVHDRQTGALTRVSVDSAGVQGNNVSYASSISADGRYVAFENFASNLVPGGPPQFAGAQYGVGVSPMCVAIGDLNGDGMPDLLVANWEPGTVSVLLGAGHGLFGSATTIGVGGHPECVAIGDLNGDGHLDLAVANPDLKGDGWVSTHLGNGQGGFGNGHLYFNLGTDPVSVAIGDLNGDGKLDLAVAVLQANTVAVLLGNGQGGFGSPTSFAVGSGPRSVAIGDLNGDGKPDLALANAGSNTVSVLLGNGQGGFGSATNFAVGSAPWSVAIGDLNGDGKPDLAVSNDGSNTVSVLLGDGQGGFGNGTNFGVGSSPLSVAIGDLNGDGMLDLIVANNGSATISLLLGDGQGGFGNGANYGVGLGPYFVAIGDLDGDGRPDIAVVNVSGTVSVLLNQGTSSPFFGFCYGDGALAHACPCGNDGLLGHGCQNSAATGGAMLSGSGAASLFADTVQLTSSAELPNALSIVMQGSSAHAALNFGGGLRCTGGTLIRLFYVAHANGGMISVPQAGDPSISARSATFGDPIPLGATRIYQVYYRDSNLGFCPGGFNVTNAVAIAWGA